MLVIIFVREIQHKNFISLHQSFHSLKAHHGAGTITDNSDLFGTFPHACPEGDPEFYFDGVPYQKVTEEQVE